MQMLKTFAELSRCGRADSLGNNNVIKDVPLHLLKATSDLPKPFLNPQQLALQLNGKQRYHSS